MRRTTVGVGLVAAMAIAGIVPEADAATLRAKYLHRYGVVKHRFGKRAPGRNIVRHGIRDGVRASNAQIARSARVLRRMLGPVTAVRSTGRGIPANAVSTAGGSAGGGGLPDCTWRPESGGDYGAVNPSSGAYGKYQIIPSTWAAHCYDLGRGPSGQEACAQRVYAAQGAGAWVGC